MVKRLKKAYATSGGTLTSMLLFLIVFSIWQVYDFLMASFSLPFLMIDIIYFATHGVCFVIFILFVKFGNADLKEHGFKMPNRFGRSLLLSIVLTVFYIVASLLPGLLFGFRRNPPLSFLAILFNVLRAIIISVTKESIFRGYIFKNFLNNQGFFTALYLSSILFGISKYDEPVSIFNILAMSQTNSVSTVIGDVLFMEILPAFIGGLFLGYMFYKMDWSILGTVVFNMGILLYSTLTPVKVQVAWWTGLTFEVIAYICMFIILDSTIQEPSYRKRRYGLEI